MAVKKKAVKPVKKPIKAFPRVALKKPNPDAIFQKLLIGILDRIEKKIDDSITQHIQQFRHVFTQYNSIQNNYRHTNKRLNEVLDIEREKHQPELSEDA